MAKYYRIGGFFGTSRGGIVNQWEYLGVIDSKEYDSVNPVTDDSGTIIDDSKPLDTFVEENNFITPYEYYGSNNNANNQLIDRLTDGKSSEDMVYFWVEDLKNWCTYDVSYNYTDPDFNKGYYYGIRFRLYVWNGKNDWIEVIRSNLPINEPYITINKVKDTYKIGKYQDVLFKELLSKSASRNAEYTSMSPELYNDQFRGMVNIAENKAPDLNRRYHNVKNVINRPYNQITTIRLKKCDRYTINDYSDFQTRRYSDNSVWLSKYATNDAYKLTNYRSLISTGIPTVWRSSTGEINMAIYMELNTDVGRPYRYTAKMGLANKLYLQKDFRTESLYNISAGDRDVYNEFIEDTDKVQFWWVDNIKNFKKYINEYCKTIFGGGESKTIKNDWLRLYKKSTDTQVEADYTNLLDSSLIFEQINSNDNNNLKCSFTVNRPVVITDDIETTDYIKKW